MRIAIILLPLIIGVSISSLVAAATLSWVRVFIVWELFWWLLVSVALGIITFRLARKVMPALLQGLQGNNYLYEFLHINIYMAGFLALLTGLSTSIGIMINGHVASAPVPLYWPLPVGACLFAVAGRAGAELSKVRSIRHGEYLRKREERLREAEIEKKHRERLKEVPIQQWMEYENQFLLSLYLVTAGNTARFVWLSAVWSNLNYEFSKEMTPHALTVWLQRKCIKLSSCLIDNDGTDLREPLSGSESLSLTATGRDLCMRAVELGGSIEAMKAAVIERFGPSNIPEVRMGDEFIFHDQATFINRPSDTIIRDFQNVYIRGDKSKADAINAELKRLVELSLSSRDLPDDDKEEVVQAVHAIAEQVRDDKVNRLTFKGALEAVKEIVVKASDVAGPAVAIIAAVLRLAGIG